MKATRPRKLNVKSCWLAGQSADGPACWPRLHSRSPRPRHAPRATPSTRRPRSAMASTSAAMASRSGWGRWHRSITASGAPLVASRCRAGASLENTSVMARMSGESGYCKLGRPVGVHVLGAVQPLAAELRRAFSIGSNGSAGVASRANSASAWNGSGRLVAPSGLNPAPPARSSATRMTFCVSVPVLSVASTVMAPSASTADMRRVSTWLLRDAPGAQRQEHGEDHRNFLRQDGHGQRNAREHAGQQGMAVPEPAEQDLRSGQHQPGHGELHDQPARRLLQPRGRLHRGGERLADAPHGRGGARGADPGQTDTLGDHGAGKQMRRAVAAGWGLCVRWGGAGGCGQSGREGGVQRRRIVGLGHRQLVHRHGLARQQGLVHRQLALHQHGVSGHAVAFVQHQQVAAHHVAPGDALFLAVTDDQRARRREVAQGFQRALRLALLRQRDADHDEHEGQQQGRLRAVAQQQVDAAGHQQHQEHRLGEDALHHAPQGAGFAAGQQVGAIGAPGGWRRLRRSGRRPASLSHGSVGPWT